jgi:hypothetical protein
MIVFYDPVTGICIRSANGVAANVIIAGGKAYYDSDLVLENMTNVAYADVPDQNIYGNSIGGIPTPRSFFELKQGIPDEVKIAALEDAMLELLTGGGA